MMIKMALDFGLFQGDMPFLGWLLGDHWVALILLSIIGINYRD